MYILLIVILFVSRWTYAGEVSLIEDAARPVQETELIENSKTTEKQPITIGEKSNQSDVKFKQMEDFVNQESDQIKSIRMLTLDLERVSLELKKREVEIKLSQLSGKASAPLTQQDSENGKAAKPRIRFLGAFIHGQVKEAMISIDGVDCVVVDGQDMVEGFHIKAINTETVRVSFLDGHEETIKLGS